MRSPGERIAHRDEGDRKGRPYGENRDDAEKRYNVILRSECDEESFRERLQKILRFAQNDKVRFCHSDAA